MITITIQAASQQEAREQFEAFFAAPRGVVTETVVNHRPAYVAPYTPSAAAPQTYAEWAKAQDAPIPVPTSAPVMPTTAAAVPTATPAPAVPTATPAYTLEDLQRAAGVVMDAGKWPELQQLLASYQIQYLGELNPDRYGEFAMGLKALGAKL